MISFNNEIFRENIKDLQGVKELLNDLKLIELQTNNAESSKEKERDNNRVETLESYLLKEEVQFEDKEIDPDDWKYAYLYATILKKIGDNHLIDSSMREDIQNMKELNEAAATVFMNTESSATGAESSATDTGSSAEEKEAKNGGKKKILGGGDKTYGDILNEKVTDEELKEKYIQKIGETILFFKGLKEKMDIVVKDEENKSEKYKDFTEEEKDFMENGLKMNSKFNGFSFIDWNLDELEDIEDFHDGKSLKEVLADFVYYKPLYSKDISDFWYMSFSYYNRKFLVPRVEEKDSEEKDSEEKDSQFVDSYDNYIEVPNPNYNPNSRQKYFYVSEKDNEGNPVFKDGVFKKITDEGKYLIDDKIVDKVYYEKEFAEAYKRYEGSFDDYTEVSDPKVDEDYYYVTLSAFNNPIFHNGTLKEITEEGKYKIGTREIDTLYYKIDEKDPEFMRDSPGNEEENERENEGGKRRNKSKKKGKKSKKRQTRKANK
jgi:dihydrofolate reductase